MHSISTPSEVGSEANFWNFNGFIGICLYSGIDKNLQTLFRDGWHDLHRITGQNVLLVCPEPSLPDLYQREIDLLPEIESSEKPTIGYVKSIFSGQSLSSQEIIQPIQESLGIKDHILPCIILTAGPNEKKFFVLRFEDLATQEGYVSALRIFVSTAKDIVKRRTIEKDLNIYRRLLIEEFEHEYLKKKLIKYFKSGLYEVSKIGLGAALKSIFPA